MQIETLIGIFSAATVLLLGILQWRSQTKVQSADAIDKIGNAYDGLLDRFEKRIADLEGRVDFLNTELKRYTNWSSKLVRQLVEHNIQPVPIDTNPKIETVKK